MFYNQPNNVLLNDAMVLRLSLLQLDFNSYQGRLEFTST